MPDGRDLPQIELTLFVGKRQTLVAGRAVESREAHLGRVAVGVEADVWPPTRAMASATNATLSLSSLCVMMRIDMI